MSNPKKLVKSVQKLIRQIWRLSSKITKTLMNWVLRSLFIFRRRSSRPSNAGFVLPTVVMVLLVVTLITTAIVFRSFDRARNATNYRVNQRVLAAVQPAIDRAEAKITALFADPTLPRSTPTDQALYQAMKGNLPKYTLGDEQPLRLVDDIDGDGNIASLADGTATAIEKDETLDTVWRFPVDTDNNGKFDSLSLYGVYFRSPPVTENRARSTLEARTPPVDNASSNTNCGGGTSAALVGSSGWFKTSDGNLKRSFYIFAATVPITDTTGLPPLPSGKEYETYKGTQGFSAIEVQQDQARVPLTNNAVVYEDDLAIDPGSGIRLNGRVMTNGNLFVGQEPGGARAVRFYQVSSINSCYYSDENGKITVGGNAVVGSIDPDSIANNAVTVDLFREGAMPQPTAFNQANASVTNTNSAAARSEVSYNSQAYAQRIDHQVQAVLAGTSPVPQDVIDRAPDPNSPERVRALETYFRNRTRRVPFAEVDLNGAAGALDPTGDALTLRPQAQWMFPDGNNGLTLQPDEPPATDPTTRPVNEVALGDRIIVGNGLPAVWWQDLTGQFVDYYDQEPQPVPNGNWTNGEPRTRTTQVVPLSDLGNIDRDGFWERSAAAPPDQPLDGVGGLRVVTGAGIYYPYDPTVAYTFNPTNPGGSPGDPNPFSFLPRPTSTNTAITTDNFSTLEDESVVHNPGVPGVDGFIVTLPDSMPMWWDGSPANAAIPDGIPQDPNAVGSTDRRGDLVMRATAVYHYRDNGYRPDPNNPNLYPVPTNAPQTPIACVSSYYDPSTDVTARNAGGSGVWQPPGVNTAPANVNFGLSNNGITYGPPTVLSTSIVTSAPDANGLFLNPLPEAPPAPGTPIANWGAVLNYQANLIYPNGRLVNEPLRQALTKRASNQPLTLADQSAIDAAVCAFQIRSGQILPNPAVIPDGAIYETTFLDARQVKATEREALADNFTNPSTLVADYNLEIEERQPLEIRATVLDLDKLRKQVASGTNSAITTTEYLLPDSGIIYATRDDALPDFSAPGADPAPSTPPADQAEANKRLATRRINSPVDFVVDPTRHPNGILLTNGSVLARGGNANTFSETERGLILASNLPVYVKADKTNPAGVSGFNLHETPQGTILEEFTQLLPNDWTDPQFYEQRTVAGRDVNFACRQNQPGLPNCRAGDLWRTATVLSDSITLLSNNFRFGFRNEGDYDLRKNAETLANNLRFQGYDFDGNGTIGDPLPANFNETSIKLRPTDPNDQGFDFNGDGTIDTLALNPINETDLTVTAARLLNGFLDNNFLTSAAWSNGANTPRDFDTTIAGIQGSSYVNNYVTPIQERGNFPEYVMEICRQPLVELCQPQDWKIYINGVESNLAVNTPVAQLLGTPTTPGAGTTARLPANPIYQRYPRRVAFRRDPSKNLILDGQGRPTPIGINATGTVQDYAYGSVPPSNLNALRFKTTSTPITPTQNPGDIATNSLFYQYPLVATTPGVGTTQQPLLIPELQIIKQPPQNNNWMQRPIEATTFNLVMAVGDNPGRKPQLTPAIPAETNGGMPNLPKFLESWSGVDTRMNGSFIQARRSAYATGPFISVLDTGVTSDLFHNVQKYATNTSQGRSAFYRPPVRRWGYDVGLLSQPPDLFSQRITTPAAGEPNRFYREVSRDDRWVKTLLCAKVQSSGENAVYDGPNLRPDARLRPNDCDA